MHGRPLGRPTPGGRVDRHRRVSDIAVRWHGLGGFCQACECGHIKPRGRSSDEVSGTRSPSMNREINKVKISMVNSTTIRMFARQARAGRPYSTTGTVYRRLSKAIFSTVLVAAVLSGCGTSDDDGDGRSVNSSPADEQARAEVAAAKEKIAPYLEAPTKVNQSEPLTGDIPIDKPWVIITCELPTCKTILDGALAAAKMAGVPTEVLSYKTTDDTTMYTAMQDALNADPIAVSPVGLSQQIWDRLQPNYREAGVKITPITVGDTTPSDVVTEGSSPQADYARDGALMADFVIADSNAQAHVLVQDVPALLGLKVYGDGFKDELSDACEDCEITKLDMAPAQLASGGVVPAIVSALQKDTSINYLCATGGALLPGLSAALDAAGITGIRVVGGSPDINNLTALTTGEQTAWTGAPLDQYGWVALDIILRTALGMEVQPSGGGRVTQILTKDNVGEPSATGLSSPADYEEQYARLWGVK